MIISPMSPIEKNWTPITVNNIPKKKSGLITVNSPESYNWYKNHWEDKYELIIVPDIENKIPNFPKKCIGLVKYLSSKIIVKKS